MAEDKSHFLLTVHGDCEPEVSDDLGSDDAIYESAKAHRCSDPEKRDGLYPIIVDWENRTIHVEAFIGDDFTEEEK